ncbi:hypothetical protein CEXT_712141 [Caerostris extrusa]|uniref:Uncharacterized protein n=1 Tax=Caerostris extrusa TaxID=172846 RepID=A0AAV4WRQ0_CAEEX|nr:hypothetical protein CEXT_712141 [Caerostris extrusa]
MGKASKQHIYCTQNLEQISLKWSLRHEYHRLSYCKSIAWCQEIVQDLEIQSLHGKKPVESEQTPYAKTDVALMYDAVWTFATALSTLEKVSACGSNPSPVTTRSHGLLDPRSQTI